MTHDRTCILWAETSGCFKPQQRTIEWGPSTKQRPNMPCPWLFRLLQVLADWQLEPWAPGWLSPTSGGHVGPTRAHTFSTRIPESRILNPSFLSTHSHPNCLSAGCCPLLEISTQRSSCLKPWTTIHPKMRKDSKHATTEGSSKALQSHSRYWVAEDDAHDPALPHVVATNRTTHTCCSHECSPHQWGTWPSTTKSTHMIDYRLRHDDQDPSPLCNEYTQNIRLPPSCLSPLPLAYPPLRTIQQPTNHEAFLLTTSTLRYRYSKKQ